MGLIVLNTPKIIYYILDVFLSSRIEVKLANTIENRKYIYFYNVYHMHVFDKFYI